MRPEVRSVPRSDGQVSGNGAPFFAWLPHMIESPMHSMRRGGGGAAGGSSAVAVTPAKAMMPPQSVHMTALATLDLTGNPVEAMPSRMRRLDNMNALLHSKQKRQALISRANNGRLSVKAAIMRDVMNPQQADR